MLKATQKGFIYRPNIAAGINLLNAIMHHYSNSGQINLYVFGKRFLRVIKPWLSFSKVAAKIIILSMGISPFFHIDTAATDVPTSFEILVGPPKSLIIVVAFIQLS